MSDTPRTDDAAFGTGHITLNFARQLERELTKAQERIAMLESRGEHTCHDNCDMTECVLRRELDEAREQERIHFDNYESIRDQLDRLVAAAKALVERWDTPFWKDTAHTGKFIRRLEDALSALKGGKES